MKIFFSYFILFLIICFCQYQTVNSGEEIEIDAVKQKLETFDIFSLNNFSELKFSNFNWNSIYGLFNSTPSPKWPNIKENHSLESPIDIITSQVEYIDLEPICVHSLFNMPDGSVKMTNTGYYFEILLNEEIKKRPYITGGPLDNCRYEFVQMHFHWGSNDSCGSEHFIDGHCHSTEVHVVFRSVKYNSWDEATQHPDGVAVLCLFGKATKQDNPNFYELVDALQQITSPKTETNGSFAEEFKFLKMLLDEPTYIAYAGSLTTKPYQKCAIFIVYPEPFEISSNQLNAFRSLISEDKTNMITMNDRPIQDIGNRRLVSPKNNKKVITSED